MNGKVSMDPLMNRPEAVPARLHRHLLREYTAPGQPGVLWWAERKRSGSPLHTGLWSGRRAEASKVASEQPLKLPLKQASANRATSDTPQTPGPSAQFYLWCGRFMRLPLWPRDLWPNLLTRCHPDFLHSTQRSLILVFLLRFFSCSSSSNR